MGLATDELACPHPCAPEGPRTKGELPNRVEKIVCLIDETGCRCSIDWAIVKGGCLEHIDHFAGYFVAALGDHIDPRLKRRIGRIVPLERGRRDPAQGAGAERAAWCVDLLISLRQSREGVP